MSFDPKKPGKTNSELTLPGKRKLENRIISNVFHNLHFLCIKHLRRYVLVVNFFWKTFRVIYKMYFILLNT